MKLSHYLLIILPLIINSSGFSQEKEDCFEIFGSTTPQENGAVGYIFPFKITSDPVSFDYEAEDILDTVYTKKLQAFCNDFQGFKSLPNKNRWFAINYQGTFYLEEPTELSIDFGCKLYGLLVIDQDSLIKVDKVIQSKMSLEPGFAHGFYQSKYLYEGWHTINTTYVHTAHEDVYFYFNYRKNERDKAKAFDFNDFKPFKKTELPNGETKIEIMDGLLFESNSSTLDSKANMVLDQIFSLYLNNTDSLGIIIEGHTDDLGESNYNKELSLKRAQSVSNYLKLNNPSLQNIWEIGSGESKPKVLNNSDSNRAKNRRVEILIMDLEKARNYSKNQ